MSNDKLRDAIRAAIYESSSSKNTDASLDGMYRKIREINGQIEILHNVYDHLQIINLCDQAINIFQSLNDEAGIAQFKAKKAQYLANELGIAYHEKNMLNLTPGWFAFSTENEKKEYELICNHIDNLNKEIDQLISEAITQAKKITNKVVLSSILICRGNINSHRFLLYKSEILKGFRAKIWGNYPRFRNWFVEFLLFIPNGDFFRIEKRINIYKKDFLLAADLALETFPINAAYAYFNLANNLRTAIRLKLAKKYLKKAKLIAISNNEDNLLRQIQSLEGIIKEKGTELSEEYI